MTQFDDMDTTPTEERTVITLKVPTALAEVLKAETQAARSSLASLETAAVSWHQGEGLPRHPARPPIVLPANPSGATVQKSMLLNPEHVDYLDRLGGRVGLARTATLLVILVQYLGDDALAPTPSR